MCTNFTKNNIERYLNELSKELKKEFGKNSEFELIIVGGASILLNYSFREQTLDVDAFISNQNTIKEAIKSTAEKYGLKDAWLNSDFKNTKSFSSKLVQYSKYYKTFNQVLQVRTIKDEYLVAMKLISFRSYKHDWSDIIGILKENPAITFKMIKQAFINLYGSLDKMSDDALDFITSELENPSDISELEKIEEENKNLLQNFEKEYSDVLNENNVSYVLQNLKDRSKSSNNGSNKGTKKMDLFGTLH